MSEPETSEDQSLTGWLKAGFKSGLDLARYYGRSLMLVYRTAPVMATMSSCGSLAASVLPFVQAGLFALSINRLTTFPDRGHSHTLAAMWPVIWPFVAMSAVVIIQRVITATLQTNEVTLQGSLQDAVELDLVAHVGRLDLPTQESPQFRNDLNRADRAANSFTAALGWVNNMAGAVISLGIAIGLVTRLNPWLIPLFIGVSLPGFVVAIRQNTLYDKLWEHGVEVQMSRMLTSYLMDSRSNTEVRLNQAHSHLAQMADKYRKSWRRRMRRVELRTNLYELGGDSLEILLQLGVEVWLVIRVLSVSSFTYGAFMFYTQIIDQFSGALATLFSQTSSGYQLALNLRAYYRVRDTEAKITSPSNPRRIPSGHVPRIEFRNVGFTYDAKDEPTLRDVNLVIEPGERVAIVGENGSGKSTLIKLLLRLYDPTEGAILLDGHDLREYSLEDWQRTLSVLMQDFNRYPLSAQENIELGQVEAAGDQKRLDIALDQAQARQVVESLKEGMQTPLSTVWENGEYLSGGQFQRFGISRSAFRTNAGVRVLDEPTAAVDAKAEAQIFESLLNDSSGQTMVIISHRFSTVCRADRVIVLGRGGVKEDGTHDQLMQLEDGIYRNLFELQVANLHMTTVS